MAQHSILEQVRDDMKVIDSAGDSIGKVDSVRFPDASTPTSGSSGGLFHFDAGIPDVARDRYRRSGYFHVDGKGWFDTDRYVTPDQIASVEGDVVHLNVPKEDLPEG